MAVRNLLHIINVGKSSFHQSLHLQEYLRQNVLMKCSNNNGKQLNSTILHGNGFSNARPMVNKNLMQESAVTTNREHFVDSCVTEDDNYANILTICNRFTSTNTNKDAIKGNDNNGRCSSISNDPSQKKKNREAMKNATSSRKHQSEVELNQFLIFVEHEPVYTVGLRDKALTAHDVDQLQALGADVHRTNRGGLVTFHGPGQLVAYPIINLKAFNLGLREYVARLERVLVDTCRLVGVEADSSGPTGTWVGDRKVASIGVNARRHVTLHGVALNCCTDLRWFDHITPCGLDGVRMTNLSEHAGRRVEVKEAEWCFLSSFINIFGSSAVSSSHWNSGA